MTVSELMELLEECDPAASVVLEAKGRVADPVQVIDFPPLCEVYITDSEES